MGITTVLSKLGRLASLCATSAAIIGLTASDVWAATPQFTSLDQSDMDALAKDFSANGMWHSATTPMSMGTVFGFELGLVAGATNSPAVNDQVKQASGQEMKMIPHA